MEKPSERTDFITYLNGKANRRNAYSNSLFIIGITLISSILIILSLYFSITFSPLPDEIKFDLLSTINNLFYLFIGLGAFYLILSLIAKLHPSLGVARASNILDDLIQDKINLQDAKKRWFNKEHNKKEGVDFIDILLLIIIFVFGILSSYHYITYKQLGVALGFLSVCIGFTSILIAYHSYKISIESKAIAEKSDEKMAIVENMNFQRIKGLFRERRLTLREKRIKLEKAIKQTPKENKDTTIHLKWQINEYEIYFSFSIWISLTYLQQIETLKERVPKKEQQSVIHIVYNFFMELLEGRDFLIEHYDKKYSINGNYPSQIRDMYSIISTFSVFTKEPKKVKVNELQNLRDILSKNIPVKLEKEGNKIQIIPVSVS